MFNLQRVRKLLINHFGSSRYWTAWSWVKAEWLLAKKNGRINFLLVCKRQKIVPLFIQNRVRTRELLRPGNHRMTTTERNFGLQVLAMIIRNEFQERKKLRKTTVEHRENMFCYSKDDYLFVKETANKLIDIEAAESNKRLTRKLQKLTINRPPTTTTRERE